MDHIHISPSEKVMLQKAERVMRLKGVEYAFYKQEQEAAGALTAPPPLVQIRSLLDKPPQNKLRNGLGLSSVRSHGFCSWSASPEGFLRQHRSPRCDCCPRGRHVHRRASYVGECLHSYEYEGVVLTTSH